MKVAPESRKVPLREIETGDVIHVEPVDAREILSVGGYERVEAVYVPVEPEPEPRLLAPKAVSAGDDGKPDPETMTRGELFAFLDANGEAAGHATKDETLRHRVRQIIEGNA